MMNKSHLHRPIALGVANAVREIFADGRHADKVIEKTMRSQRQWGGRDRRLFAETVYDLIRWWRRLQYAAETGEFGESLDLQKIVDGYLVYRWPEQIPDWLKGAAKGASAFRRRYDEPHLARAVRESIPDWLDGFGEAQLGDGWASILASLNRVAPAFLRANSLKINARQLIDVLNQEKIQAELVMGVDPCLKLLKRGNVFRTKAFADGLFEMQDGGSQQLAPLLDPQPGQRVVDACAGAGGKTLHLAALMKNKGRILAMDIHQWKLDELRKRAARAGVDIVETRLIESSKVVKRMEKTADAVLLDVPCSGSGVLRRNPDTKWKLTGAEIERLIVLQRELLQSYSEMTKPGGVLVYATCSIFPIENQQQIEQFLGRPENSKWQLETELHIRPDQSEFDGFYGAKLKRLP